MVDRKVDNSYGRAVSATIALSLLAIAFVPVAQAEACTLTECADVWSAYNGGGAGAHYPVTYATPPGVQGVGVLQVNGATVDHCSWDGINDDEPMGCTTEGEAPSPRCTTVTAETYWVTEVADEDEWCPGDGIVGTPPVESPIGIDSILEIQDSIDNRVQ